MQPNSELQPHLQHQLKVEPQTYFKHVTFISLLYSINKSMRAIPDFFLNPISSLFFITM